ncbi:hypothetical protein JY651_42375 [Pyxidicoccus parkwayensis]|uniref:Uncharacterized protein n=1 Tax=Pyxidicoccus parkwayensis TaxID=2813578 RepID=A0ABX7NS70_9BACT|nr:hypothetical protein [Pyxidicoccus parkwaysis]QSQ21734.1 hypothetical protein JY651_42375 [Pyxidicoccus parkwaysis]
MLFANARGLELPPDAEQRFAQWDAAASDALIAQMFIEPEKAAATLLAVAHASGH